MALFSILQYSVMVKGGGYLSWRKNKLLAENTLLAVVTFPPELFYPIGVHTVGIFIKKGIPHPEEQNVLWIRAINDGLVKVKGKRLSREFVPNDFIDIRDSLSAFIMNPFHPIENRPQFQKASPINFRDAFLELVPEEYLDDVIPTIDIIRNEIDKIPRETIAFQITKNIEFNLSIQPEEEEINGVMDIPINRQFTIGTDPLKIKAGDFHAVKELDEGLIPLISCGEIDNGFVSKLSIPTENQYNNTITIAFNGKPLTSRFHATPFGAKDDVAVLINNTDLRSSTLIYIAAMLNLQTWRFSYGRKCFKSKLKKQIISLPVDENGDIDEEYIEFIVKQTPFWKYISPQRETT